MEKSSWKIFLSSLAIIICILFVALNIINVIRTETKKEKENLTWQMEHLDIGESFTTPVRNYSHAIREFQQQLKDPEVMFYRVIEFGDFYYRLVDYKPGGAIEKIYMAIDDCRYKIEIDKAQYEKNSDESSQKTMTLTRY